MPFVTFAYMVVLLVTIALIIVSISILNYNLTKVTNSYFTEKLRNSSHTSVLTNQKSSWIHKIHIFFPVHLKVKSHIFVKTTLGWGEGNGNPLQCSFLANPMDRGAW